LAFVIIPCSKASSASAGSRFAGEHMPGVWLWNVIIHLAGGLPMGSAKDLDTAKAEFGGLGQP
jgi:hypothetical protein